MNNSWSVLSKIWGVMNLASTRFVQDEDRYILRSHVRNTHAKKLVMLGGETCDIFRSCIRNKMCQGACYVRCWNLWHFPFSRNHRIGIGYRDLGLCHSFSHLQSAVSLVEMNPPIRIGIRSPRDRSGSDHRIWSIFWGTDLMASQLAQKSVFLAKNKIKVCKRNLKTVFCCPWSVLCYS